MPVAVGDPEPQKFLRLWVADDGPGMSPELQTQLFQENFSGFLTVHSRWI